MTATAVPATTVRYRCDLFPFLKVRVAADLTGDYEQITYAEFSAGVLDLRTDDPLYGKTVAALERASKGGTPIALIGAPADDEDVLGKLSCREPGCGYISRNEKSVEAHKVMHARQKQVAAEAPDRIDND